MLSLSKKGKSIDERYSLIRAARISSVMDSSQLRLIGVKLGHTLMWGLRTILSKHFGLFSFVLVMHKAEDIIALLCRVYLFALSHYYFFILQISRDYRKKAPSRSRSRSRSRQRERRTVCPTATATGSYSFLPKNKILFY